MHLIGNKAYDLASLIDDVRFKTSNVLKEKILYSLHRFTKKIKCYVNLEMILKYYQF